MSVTVRLFAVLRERAGWSVREFESVADESASQLWERVVVATPALGGLPAVLRFALNGVYAEPESPVHEGDELAVLPPMSGG